MSIAQPTGVVRRIAEDPIEARERPDAEEQRVDQNRGPHPEQHQQAEQQPGEEDLRAGPRPHEAAWCASVGGSPASRARLFS